MVDHQSKCGFSIVETKMKWNIAWFDYQQLTTKGRKAAYHNSSENWEKEKYERKKRGEKKEKKGGWVKKKGLGKKKIYIYIYIYIFQLEFSGLVDNASNISLFLMEIFDFFSPHWIHIFFWGGGVEGGKKGEEKE